MATLSKRSTATLIAVAVIILGTLFGVHRSVGSQSARIEAQFYGGVFLKDGNYTQPSIQSQLDKRATAALGLASLGSSYDVSSVTDKAEALRQARNDLLNASTITGKYIANEKLQSAYKAFSGAVLGIGPADKAEAFKSYSETMDGAQSIIEKSAYNAEVTAFLQQLRSFPVNILKNLAFVNYPEYFGAEG
jgi:hypothetical protein